MPGTQRWRRMLRSMHRYYRKRDPWDFVARDAQLDLAVEHGERRRIRAAEREYIRRELDDYEAERQ